MSYIQNREAEDDVREYLNKRDSQRKVFARNIEASNQPKNGLSKAEQAEIDRVLNAIYNNEKQPLDTWLK